MQLFAPNVFRGRYLGTAHQINAYQLSLGITLPTVGISTDVPEEHTQTAALQLALLAPLVTLRFGVVLKLLVHLQRLDIT